ncbi:MAG: hypothetical protein KC731_11715 [Myxococcales bacterium]|nr:hypothetical protein [Myxococcales bacterium]
MDDDLRQSIDQRMAILARLESILIDDLEIPFEPGTIDPDAPLFGTGLALDSMDAIELVIRAEEAFSLRLPTPDDLQVGMRTLNRLVDLVLRQQRNQEGSP